MRLESLTIKGLLAFDQAVTLDARDLPPGLIAIRGENGEGKTTLLEGALGALYRRLPSRDQKLTTYALGKDAFLDYTFSVEGRGVFRTRVNLDGIRETSDAVIEQLLPDGTHVPLNDGKVSTFDQVIARDFVPNDVLLASAFIAQGRTDEFAKKPPKEQKGLFLKFLGLERYDALAATAKQAVAIVDQARARLVVLRDELQRSTGPTVLADLEQHADQVQREIGVVQVRRHTLQAQMQTLEDRLALMQDAVAAYAAARQRHATIVAELQARETEQARLPLERTRIVARADDERHRARAKANADHLGVERKRDAVVAEHDKKILSNQQVQAKAAAIRAAVASLVTLGQQHEALRIVIAAGRVAQDETVQAHRQAEQALVAVRQSAAALADAQRGATLLTVVPFGQRCAEAGCSFVSDAATQQARIPDLTARVAPKAALEQEVADLDAISQRHRAALAQWARDETALTTATAQAQAIAKYETDLAAADAKIEGYRTASAQAVADAQERVAAIERDLQHATAEIDRRQQDSLTVLFDAETALAADIRRLVDLRDTAAADLMQTEGEHTHALAVQRDLADARRAWDVTTGSLATLEATVQALARERARVGTALARLDAVQTRLTRLDQDLIEWQQLARALGRDGLSVLEIDAAGPAVSAYANAMLETGYGPRFTVELVTQRAKADGKGMVEDFAIQVYDNQKGGAPRAFGDLSGGEKVIVAEALSNAILVYVNARSAMPIRTIWRDESTGALSTENVSRYVLMLRSLHDSAHATYTFFVTHSDLAASMADAQIIVKDGTLQIVWPPFGLEVAA